jgi:hypothetical protein
MYILNVPSYTMNMCTIKQKERTSEGRIANSKRKDIKVACMREQKDQQEK